MLIFPHISRYISVNMIQSICIFAATSMYFGRNGFSYPTNALNSEKLLPLVTEPICQFYIVMQTEPIFHAVCPPKSRVPTGTGKQGKPGKMGDHFPVKEKSGNFVQTGKVREFYPNTGKVLN